MLMPRRVKYRKQQRGRMKGKAKEERSFSLVSGASRRLSRPG
ncbi:hypothetical protein LA10_05211 [Thermotoga neapolitana LA10]|nr:hypothetical protein LA10_05211 [Thermotoga neapolitana LA10]